MMKKFDLEAAKRGEPITCKHFSSVRFIAYDEKLKTVITAVSHGFGEEVIKVFYDAILSDNPLAPLTIDSLAMYEPIRKQFDYDEYIKNPSGWRLETRHGKKCEYIGVTERTQEDSQIFYVCESESDGKWADTSCSKNGVFLDGENKYDLFMIEVTT